MTFDIKERASAEVTARVGNLGLDLGCFVGRLMNVNGARMSSVAVQACPASALTLPAMIESFLPWSPTYAASIVAFNASRLVWLATFSNKQSF